MTILENLEESKRQSLYDTLQRVIESFRTLNGMTNLLDGSVPLEVLALADQGKNPDEFARDLIRKVHESAKRVEAKQKWMRYLKDSLDGLIRANFPGECLVPGPDQDQEQ
jgi:hypothetical protein